MKVGAKQVATSSVLLFAENLVRLSAYAAISFWIARYLGPSQFGILNSASALMTIFLSFAAMGLDTPVILRLTQVDKPEEIIGTVLAIRVLASIITLIVAITFIYILKHDKPSEMTVGIIVSLCIVAYSPNIFDYWFKSKTSALLPATARTIGTLLAVSCKAACIIFGLGLLALAWTVLLEAVLAGLGLIIIYFYSIKKLNNTNSLILNIKLGKSLLRESWPYMLSGVAVIVYMKVDVVILGYLSTNEETGIYSLAQKLSEVLYMIPMVLIDSAYPALAKRYLANDKKDNQHGQMLFDFAVGVSIIATIFAVLLAKPVISILFGSGYERSIGIFYVHAWSCIAIALNVARNQWLATVGLQRYALIVTLIGLLVNLVMNFALIPSFGAMGAAVATIVSYFLSGYFISFAFPQLRNIGWMQTRALWPWVRLQSNLKAMIKKVN